VKTFGARRNATTYCVLARKHREPDRRCQREQGSLETWVQRPFAGHGEDHNAPSKNVSRRKMLRPFSKNRSSAIRDGGPGLRRSPKRCRRAWTWLNARLPRATALCRRGVSKAQGTRTWIDRERVAGSSGPEVLRGEGGGARSSSARLASRDPSWGNGWHGFQDGPSNICSTYNGRVRDRRATISESWIFRVDGGRPATTLGHRPRGKSDRCFVVTSTTSY